MNIRSQCTKLASWVRNVCCNMFVISKKLSESMPTLSQSPPMLTCRLASRSAHSLHGVGRVHACLIKAPSAHRHLVAARHQPVTTSAARSENMASRTALEETSVGGEFKRTDAGFRSVISPTNPRFLPEGVFLVLDCALMQQ